MDKERETHDLMNVESFSQLPFIRPAPPIKEKGIRLFGIEFGGATDDSESAETITAGNNSNNNNAFELDSANNKDNNSSSTENGESSRRFECHYCCRNFPTSQALGGHQNAHKRERQHAKRAHLQSTMVHASTFSDPHLYHHHHPLINYRFASSSPTTPMPSYPTTNFNSSNPITTTTSASAGRFYGSHGATSYSQPINGSPLAFWRIPNGTVQSNPSFSLERSSLQHHPLPLFAGEEINNVRASQVGPSASQNRYVYDSKRSTTVHDHVSLDLHL